MLSGKFEGCEAFVESYWNESMMGNADESFFDENDNEVSVFKITDADADIHPSLGEYIGLNLCIWETEAGFVYSHFCSDEELEEHLEFISSL